MASITEENNKILRKTPDVVVGVAEEQYQINIVSDSSGTWYQSVVNTSVYSKNDVRYLNKVIPDLSGDGFYLDGGASSYYKDDSYDYVNARSIEGKTVNTSVVFTITAASSGTFPAGQIISIAVLDRYANVYMLYKTITTAGSTQTITVNKSEIEGFPDGDRLRIAKIIAGRALYYGSNNISECVMNLRGVETKLVDPELQMSEISIVAIDSEDKSSIFQWIPEYTQILIFTGYAVSGEERFFYLSDVIQQNGVEIEIKGTDATVFLDTDWKGTVVDVEETDEAFENIKDALFDIVDSTLDEHDVFLHTRLQYYGGYSPATQSASDKFLFPPSNIRSIIANATNIWNAPDAATNGEAVYTTYRDAGYPILSVYGTRLGSSFTIPLSQISEMKVEAEPLVKQINLKGKMICKVNNSSSPYWDELDQRNLAWVGYDSYVVETSDPCEAFKYTDGSGTTRSLTTDLGNYKVSVPCQQVGTMEQTTYGTKLTEWEWLSTVYTATKSGIEELTLQDQEGRMLVQTTAGEISYHSMVEKFAEELINRSNKLYTIKYRGNYGMYPRDTIVVDGTTMTIESLTLEFKDGGFSSEIIARGGLV